MNWCPIHKDYCKVGCMMFRKLDEAEVKQLSPRYNIHPDLPGICGIRAALDDIAAAIEAVRQDGIKMQLPAATSKKGG